MAFLFPWKLHLMLYLFLAFNYTVFLSPFLLVFIMVMCKSMGTSYAIIVYNKHQQIVQMLFFA